MMSARPLAADSETNWHIILSTQQRAWDKNGKNPISAVDRVNTILANVNSRSRSLYAVARPSVVCLSPATLVHPIQPLEIFGNISTAFGTFGYPLTSTKNLTEIIPGEPLGRGVRHDRGSQI